MKIHNLYFGIVSYVCDIEYPKEGMVKYSKPIDFSVYYIKKDMGIDFVNKKKYPLDNHYLGIGEDFICIYKYGKILFCDFVIMMENQLDKKYELKNNMSRKDVIKLLKDISEDLKTKEIETKEKTKRFDLK